MYADVCRVSVHLQTPSYLTELNFGGIELFEDALDSISQCQQLKSVGFVLSNVSAEGLEHLTRLSRLTRLRFKPVYSTQPEDIDMMNQVSNSYSMVQSCNSSRCMLLGQCTAWGLSSV